MAAAAVYPPRTMALKALVDVDATPPPARPPTHNQTI